MTQIMDKLKYINTIQEKNKMLPIPQFLKDIYKRNNLRPFESTWLIYVHILGLIGLLYVLYRYDIAPKLFGFHVLFHVFFGLGITAGAHRLWAHKSYNASLPMRVLLMIMNSGANQGSIFHWSRDHRLHHKFSDTDLDPHDISKGFFFAHVGWLLVNKSPQLVEEGKRIDMTDLLNDPVVMFQKKHYLPLSVAVCFLLPTLTYYFVFGMPFFFCFCLSMTTYAIILNCTWCVNSVCHMFGTRPYNKNIQPTENYLVSLVTGGEGYHNWHHEYPSDWKASKDEWYMYPLNYTARFLEIASLFQQVSFKM